MRFRSFFQRNPPIPLTSNGIEIEVPLKVWPHKLKKWIKSRKKPRSRPRKRLERLLRKRERPRKPTPN